MRHKITLLCFALLIIANILAYSAIIEGDFISDDHAWFVNNPNLNESADVIGFFKTGIWTHSNVEASIGNVYRPIFLILLWINSVSWGESPTGYHIVSLVLHIVNMTLLFFAIWRWSGKESTLPAFIGAMVFSLHPVHVEAVSWISSLVHLQTCFFALVTVIFYIEHQRTDKSAFLLIATICFIFGLLSGETIITLPFVLLSYDILVERRLNWKSITPFLLSLGAYFLLRKSILGATVPLALGEWQNWLVTGSFLLRYLQHMIAPFPQYLHLEPPDPAMLFPSILLVSGGIVLIFALTGLIFNRKNPWLAFASCWLLIMLAPPVISALNPRPLFALRSMYLPSIGLALAAAWTIGIYFRRYRVFNLVSLLALCLTATFTIRTMVGNWKNDAEVYGRLLKAHPEFDGAHAGLAGYYERNKDLVYAVTHNIMASRYAVDASNKAGYLSNVGRLYVQHWQLTSGKEYYKQAIEIAPETVSAWIGLGNVAWLEGNIAVAAGNYRRAVELKPNNNEACLKLMRTLSMLPDRSQLDHRMPDCTG